MRVLQVAEAYSSGIMVVVDAIAQALAAGGHEVTIGYGRRPETPARPTPPGPGIELVALPWAARTVTDQVRAGAALRRLVLRTRPDIVHLHSSFAGTVGSLVIDRSVLTVYSPHSYAFSREDSGRVARRAYVAAERWVARRVSVVGACSHSEALLAREVAHAPRVTSIPNGIAELDHPRVRRETSPPRHQVVVSGRVGPQRRPLESALILAGVRDLAEVLWVGGGNEGEDGIRAITAHGIALTGWLPRSDALSRLRDASIVLHWSAWDGLSLSILEALAEDVVVVASDIPANREILGPDQVCRSPREAIALVRHLIASPEQYMRALDAQRRRRSYYSAARASAEWVSLYRQLLAGRREWNRPAEPRAGSAEP